MADGLISVSRAAREFGVDERTVLERLSDDDIVSEDAGSGGRILCVRSGVARALQDIVGVTRSIESGKVFTTRSGRRYATLPIAADHYGISKPFLESRLQGVRTLPARIRSKEKGLSRVVALVCLDDLEKHPDIKALVDAREETLEDPDRGKFPDYISIGSFWNALSARTRKGTSKQAIRRQAKKSCRSKPNPRRPGTFLYNRADLWQNAMKLIDGPGRVNRKTGFYLDSANKKWATRDTWEKKRKVTTNALNKGMRGAYRGWENAPRIRGVGMVGREEWLYPEDAIDEMLRYIFEAQYQIREDGSIRKITGQTRRRISGVYKNVNELAAIAHITAGAVRKKLPSASCGNIKPIHRTTGQEFILYKLRTARRILKDQIETTVNADDTREINSPRYGRAVLLIVFIEEAGKLHDIKWRIKFARAIKKEKPIGLRRRARGLGRLFIYYPVDQLKRIAAKVNV